MKQKQQALPEFTTDADGQRLAHVALANSQLRATLYAEDYERLLAAGFSRHWQYTEDGRGSAYVTLNAFTPEGQSRMVPVARLIVGAGHGERVRTIDGRTLNLRRENLDLYPGTAWYNASDWYPSAEALRAAGIEPLTKAQRGSRGLRKGHGKKTPGTPQEAGMSVAQPVPHATPASRPRGPQRTPQRQPVAPSAPQVAHEPRTVDRAALSARVRERLAQQPQQ